MGKKEKRPSNKPLEDVQRVPRWKKQVSQSKVAQHAEAPGHRGHCPAWAFRYADSGGRWPLFEFGTLQELSEQLCKWESQAWNDVLGSHNHGHSSGIVDEAWDRLVELELADVDPKNDMYSLRVTGAGRLWGILWGSVFHLLWWDPKHEVDPSSSGGKGKVQKFLTPKGGSLR